MRSRLFIFLLLFTHTALMGQLKQLTVVPQPSDILFTDERFEVRQQTISLKMYCDDYTPLKLAQKDLQHTFTRFCQSTLSQNGAADKEILIGLEQESDDFKKILQRDNIEVNDSFGEEGYILIIKTDKIIIAANHQRGLFYGMQTLKQMSRGTKGKSFLPGVIIKDIPAFKYRAISDDISRGPVPTMAYMKYQVRRFAEMKINTIIHYVEHVVKTKSHPKFAPDNGSLSIDEWKEIADYALDYNITIVGGFQSFGHFQKVLESPEYAHLGESGSLLSPMLDESYEFLEDIYEEMIPAFHSDLFCVHSDETFDLGKGASKVLVDSIGYAGAYAQHMVKLYDIVKKNGKRMLMWGDIIMQNPELLDMIPKDVLIGTWDYDARETFSDFIDPFKNAGFEFWVVPGVLNSLKIYPDFDRAFKNIDLFANEGYEAGASGVMTCFWDLSQVGLFSNVWYGAYYGADKSWNPNSDNTSFDARYSAGALGCDNINFARAVQKLNELRLLELTDGMKDKFLFERLLPQKGKRFKVSVADLDKALIIIDNAEILLKQANLQLYDEDGLYLQFAIDLYRTLAQERFDLLQAAELYAAAQKEMSTDKAKARSNIVRSIALMTKIANRQKEMKSGFEVLWLKENHMYSLDWITDKYAEKIKGFESVRTSLFESLNRIDSSLPMLSTENAGLGISKLPGKYFTEWMMPTPIINKDKKALSKTDYLTAMGGHSKAIPKVTQEFYFEGHKYRWSRVVSAYPDINNLVEVFAGDTDNKVIYAFANITCNEDMSVTAAVGCDEGIEIFINGEKVYDTVSSGKMTPDEFEFELPLKQGKNNLLIKSSQTSGEWAFTFRLPGLSVRNHKNRYRIVD